MRVCMVCVCQCVCSEFVCVCVCGEFVCVCVCVRVRVHGVCAYTLACVCACSCVQTHKSIGCVFVYSLSVFIRIMVSVTSRSEAVSRDSVSVN